MTVFEANRDNTTSILLVDLEATARRSLSFILGEKKYQITEADSVDAALSLLAERSIDVILVNFGKHKPLSLEVVKKIRQNSCDTEVVVMTVSPDPHLAVKALQAGAFDCFDTTAPPEQLMLKLYKAAEHSRLKRQLFALREEVALSNGIGDIGLARHSHLNGNDTSGGSLTPLQENRDGVKVPVEKRTGNGLLHDSQQAVIMKALADNNWNFTHTAHELGIGRTTLWRKMKKYNLKREYAEK
jgi:DNA-binding NtrC family response regulator